MKLNEKSRGAASAWYWMGCSYACLKRLRLFLKMLLKLILSFASKVVYSNFIKSLYGRKSLRQNICVTDK